MRLCWFDDYRLGVVHDGVIADVTNVLETIERKPYPHREGDLLVSHLDELRPRILDLAPRARTVPIEGARFLSPVARPTKIIGTPANYLKHVEEAVEQRDAFTQRYAGGIREQGLFLKAVSALIGPSQGVVLRFPSRRNDHEMELGVIIGRRASEVSPAEALDHVAGYAIALDMVVRGPEDRSLRKSIDTYAVLGPWLVTADEVPNPGELDFKLDVNGEIRQSSNTRFMILGIAEQISWASQFYTLWPGDILMTGTCEGVGPVRPGDVMTCEIQSIGSMRVAVR